MRNRKTYLLLALLVTAVSCTSNDVENTDAPPPLFSQPQTFPLNIEEGYKVNVVTGDSILPFILKSGDTLITGAPIRMKGAVMHPDSVALPKVVQLTVPSVIIDAHANVHKVPDNLTTTTVNHDLLTRIEIEKIGDNDTSHYALNSTGDTIKTGVKIPVKGTIMPPYYPKPISASPARFKDNVSQNLQFLDVDQGMPSPYIYATLQDVSGNMWFGTDGGLTKYNGQSFTHFTVKEGLSSNHIRSMMIDRKGNIWCGTYDNGISMYNGESFTHFTEKEGLIQNGVWALFEDRNGNVWFGGGKTLTKYDGESFTHFAEKEGVLPRPISISETKNGDLWIGTAHEGAFKYDGESFTHFTVKDGLSDNHVFSIYEDEKTGDIWFGTDGGGVSIYNGKSFTYIQEKDGLSSNFVMSILQDNAGNMWFATWGNGACMYDGESFTHITENDGLPNNILRTILEDKDGNIWLGSFGSGVSRYTPKSFTHFTKKEGLSENFTHGQVEDKSGNIWFGTFGGGASRYDGETFTHFTKNEGLSNDYITSIIEDKRGDLWFGTFGGGLNKFNGESFTQFSELQGLTCMRIWSITEAENGDIWMVGNEGISMYNGEFFTNYTQKEGLSTNYYMSSFEDRDGNIWFGSDAGGALMYDGEFFTYFTEKEGMSDNGIQVIFQDESGSIWFATDGGGVSRFDGETFTHFTEKEGLSSNNTFSIIQDKQQNLWVGTANGLTKFIPNSNSDKFKLIAYNKGDGLKSLVFSERSVLIDSKNQIWWGTGNGAARLNLNKLPRTRESSAVALQQVDINEQFIVYRNIPDSLNHDLTFKKGPKFENYPLDLELPYYKNHLTFYFSAIDCSSPHKIQYSYLMEGLTTEWSQPSHENKADYRNLPYGSYTFKVCSIGASGEWSVPFEYTFTISPPWWHTSWARTLYVIVGTFLLFIIIRSRTAKLKNRQKELETEVEEATKEILEQKEKAVQSEAFKQQFLANMSHEIRTPMNAVMGMTNLLLDKTPREDQFDYLDGIKKSSDNLLHIINDILDLSKIEAGKMELEDIDFSIADSVKQVKQTLSHKAEEKGLELVVTIKGNVNDVVLGDPVRLNQVLINLAGNAVKFTEKGSVNIVITSSDEGVQFSIIDTGIGIPEEKLQTVFENFSQANASDTRKYGGTGLGLSISRQLVELMGSGISIESKEGSGTTFSFIVAFKAGSAERLEERLALERSVDGTILNGLRILITDDNEYNRIVARDTLKSKANVEIHEAENGQMAVDMVAKMDYDAVLMDVQMPVMNGYMATQNIRAMEGTKGDTPIIALTASVLRVDLDKCTDAGMNSYIPKPFKAQELIAGIATVLGIKLRTKNVEKTASKQEVNQDKVSEITDMTYLSNFCDGDQEKMNKYILMFTKSAPALLEKLNKGLEEKDFETIANQVHGFKTKFIMMGMSASKELGSELETICRNEPENSSIPVKVQLLIDQLGQAIIELSNNEK